MSDRIVCVFVGLLLTSACQAPGAVHSLRVRSLEGELVAPLDSPDARATLLFFVGADCPTSNAYAPEIVRIHEEYAPRGIACHLVYWDAEVTVDEIRRQLHDYELDLPVLLDFGYVLVDHTGATRMPEVALLSPEGQLVYRGRIDDRYVDFGKRRVQANQHDLRDALDAVLEGKLPKVSRTEAVGCFISRPDR